jgi:hypothetical protein
MSTSRYLVVGVVTRHGGRWAIRRRYRPWSPTRALLLALLAWVPPKVLGFLVWEGAAAHLPRRLRLATRPGPLVALGIVLIAIGIELVRDRLPAVIERRLPA